jgi:hypothetical protein
MLGIRTDPDRGIERDPDQTDSGPGEPDEEKGTGPRGEFFWLQHPREDLVWSMEEHTKAEA